MKFKDKYVLAVGYPGVVGMKNYQSIAMYKQKIGYKYSTIKWFNELWDDNVPKYELILRKVKK